MSLLQRFWDKVDTSGECWRWTAGTDGNGYGRINLGGRGYGALPAHRVAYTLTYGHIPTGLFLDHRCHNSVCVRPSHLRPVTRKENGEHRRAAQQNSSSGIRGVNRSGSSWRATAVHNGKRYTNGTYDTIAEAEQAATALRNRLFSHNDLDRVNS